MRFLLLLAAYAGIVLALDTESTDDVNVGKTEFPYMAFLYYPDDSIVDDNGARITKSAVLIKENWLISSSFSDTSTSDSFPKKTLMARMGAIKIDNNFTLNEDENEQEREIIQIASPYKFNRTLWWYSDISLLKTLSPFTTTPAVSVVPKISKRSYSIETSCYVLLYLRFGNTTEERTLMKGPVDLLPASPNKCGSNFKNDTMLCAAPRDKNDAIFSDPNFCEGNSGGPLLCDNELTGVQTYINDCKQPFLYQRLSAWKYLLSCAIQEQCSKNCSTICFLINKDPVANTTLMAVTPDEDNEAMFDNEFKNNSYITNTDKSSIIPTLTTTTTTEATTQDTTMSTEIVTESKLPANKKVTLTHKTLRIVENTSFITTEITSPDNEDIEVRKTVVKAQRHKLRSKASYKICNLIPYFTSVTLIITYFT